VLNQKKQCPDDQFDFIVNNLELDHLLDREIEVLSGGELQRFAIAIVSVQQADVYMFDEPSSYLDVKQRLKAAYVIRSIVNPTEEELMRETRTGENTSNDNERKELNEEEEDEQNVMMGRSNNSNDEEEEEEQVEVVDQEKAERKRRKNRVRRYDQRYVVVVEHDLAVLDYLSDYVCCLYGVPSAYGVVSMPSNVRDGINIFLSGFIPSENLRFRDEELTFKISQSAGDDELIGQVSNFYDIYFHVIISLCFMF